MRRARWVIVSLVVVAFVVPAAATPAATTSTGRPTALQDTGAGLAADSTSIEIAVGPDGTAEWTVQYRVQLDTAEETSSFERVEQRIEADPLNYTGPFTEQMQDAADVAAEETGRSMTVGNTSVSARSTTTGYGVVTYRFEWSNFAVASNGQLRVGDALVGFFLGNEDTTLIVAWPASHDLERASPEPDETRDGSVVWQGPTEFASNEPRVVVSGGLPVPAEVLAVATLALVVVAAGWRLGRNGPGITSVLGWGATGDDGTAGAAGGTGGGAVPDELLSDPERVLNLVEANGGRMKQQAVVDELEWSETKTSQVVNELKADGELEVYRIGRENVLTLPGEMDV